MLEDAFARFRRLRGIAQPAYDEGSTSDGVPVVTEARQW